MFEAYLTERGIDVPEHEPDLGVGVRPEYLVEHAGDRCLIEVKEFAPESWPIKDAKVKHSFSQGEILKPIRGQIHQAARKLRRTTELGYPLVVVLTDPKSAMFGLLRPIEIIAAMVGDLQFQIPVSSIGPMGSATLTAGRNGELRHDHPYISAVMVIHERSVDEHVAHTFITNSPQALTLSTVFFRGPNDLVFEYSDNQQAYVEVPTDPTDSPEPPPTEMNVA